MTKPTKQTFVIDLCECESSETDELKVEVTVSNSNNNSKKDKPKATTTRNHGIGNGNENCLTVEPTENMEVKHKKLHENEVILEVEEEGRKPTAANVGTTSQTKEENTEVERGVVMGNKRKANQLTTNENQQTMEAMKDGSYYHNTSQRPRFRVTRKQKKPPPQHDDDDNDDRKDPWAQSTRVTYPVPIGNKVYYRKSAEDRKPLIRIYRFHGSRHPPLQEHLEDVVKSYLQNKFPLPQADNESMYAHGPNELRDTTTTEGEIKDGSVLARIDFYSTTHKDYDEEDYSTLCLQTVETHVIYTMGKGTLSLIVASNCFHVFKHENNLWKYCNTKTLRPGNNDDLVCVRPCTVTQYLDDPNFVSTYPVC